MWGNCTTEVIWKLCGSAYLHNWSAYNCALPVSVCMSVDWLYIGTKRKLTLCGLWWLWKEWALSFIKSHMLVTSWCFTSYQITFFTVTWPESAAAAAESFQITCFALLGCSLYWFVRGTCDAKAMLTLTVSHQDERKWNCYILKYFMWLHQQMVAYFNMKVQTR